MAVRACEEADFWARARADPKVAFPGVCGFMARSFHRKGVELMNGEAKGKLRASMTAAIEEYALSRARTQIISSAC